MKKITLLAGMLLATTAVPAMAAKITYTISGKFSGTSVDGAFNDVQATFTGVGDTTTATTGGFGIPSYVAIQLSTFKAVTPVNGFVYNITSQGTFGLYKAGDFQPGNTQTRLGFIFNGDGSNGIALESNAYNGYSGLTGFATTGGNVYYQTASFGTSRGDITITGFTDGSFSAAVPEAATWAMMLAGFGVVGGAVRRRAKVRTAVTYA